MLKILIRFNTNYPEKSIFQWRLIVNMVEEHLVNEIDIRTASRTTAEVVDVEGQSMLKHHIYVISDKIDIRITSEGKKAIIY